MFKSIKSKVIILTAILLITLTILLSFTTFAYYKYDKVLIIESCDFSIATFAEQINKQITKMNNNVSDLATMGEIYYQTGKSNKLANFIVKKYLMTTKILWVAEFGLNHTLLRKTS